MLPARAKGKIEDQQTCTLQQRKGPPPVSSNSFKGCATRLAAVWGLATKSTLRVRTYLNGISTHKTPSVVTSALVTRLAHWCHNFLRKALSAEGLIVVRLGVPERVAELVVISFETQFVTKLAILVLKFRSGLLQVSQLVHNFVDLMYQFLIFQRLPKLIELLGYFSSSLCDCPRSYSSS